MASWIPAWIFVFAGGMLVAMIANREDWHKNRGVAALMLAVMLCSGWIFWTR